MSTTTVLYTDIARSSQVLADGGDEHYARLFTHHVATIRRAVEAQHGEVSKLLGDGVLATFDSAYGAVRAARGIQQAVELDGRAAGAIPLAIRIGIAVGEVVEVDDEIYGATLVLARRLCDVAAQPGEIVATDLVRALLTSRGDVEFDPLGHVLLKGIEHPVEAWRVPWEPLPPIVGLRVIVADDAALIRSGVVHLVRAGGFDVIAEVADADALVAAVDLDPPDLVVTDIRMPPTNTDDGLRAAAAIRQRHPQVAVLLLSQYLEAESAARLLDRGRGGIGYLLKERVSDIDEFLDACRAVASGDSVIDPTIGERLIEARESSSPLSSLTPREREALALMAQGRSNQALAGDLFVSAKTVETYIRAIFQKLGLIDTPDEHRRVRAVLEWLKDAPRP
jgi:DNA-binding NarL/FixJ family response regulator/class 3 adenylate cyclase